jgi:hypothetical protein
VKREPLPQNSAVLLRMVQISPERMAQLDAIIAKRRRPVWTYELAMAAGKDAANARMRKAGRSKWNRADYNEACRTFNRLFPEPTP